MSDKAEPTPSASIDTKVSANTADPPSSSSSSQSLCSQQVADSPARVGAAPEENIPLPKRSDEKSVWKARFLHHYNRALLRREKNSMNGDSKLVVRNQRTTFNRNVNTAFK